MKVVLKIVLTGVVMISSLHLFAQTTVVNNQSQTMEPRHLFIDVHRLKPGTVKLADVAQAHTKDLAVEGKYNVQLLKYWVDEKQGLIFCLASAPDSSSIRKTHADAHGLLPERIYPVTGETETALTSGKNLYLDIHHLGAGVTAKDVAAAHEKDLATEGKYGVNITNYWLNEKEGIVMCLAEAKDSSALIKTHKEAHGLVPDMIFKVKQGQ